MKQAEISAIIAPCVYILTDEIGRKYRRNSPIQYAIGQTVYFDDQHIICTVVRQAKNQTFEV